MRLVVLLSLLLRRPQEHQALGKTPGQAGGPKWT